MFAGDIGHSVAVMGEARLSTATVETFLDTGLFEPMELFLEIVDFAVLFMLNICNQSRRQRTNAMKCLLPRPYIEADMQISVGKGVKGLELPSLKDTCAQGRAHPSP